MITIYDADGNPKEVESVDAREHLATGQWFESPPEPPDEPKAKKGDAEPKAKRA